MFWSTDDRRVIAAGRAITWFYSLTTSKKDQLVAVRRRCRERERGKEERRKNRREGQRKKGRGRRGREGGMERGTESILSLKA